MTKKPPIEVYMAGSGWFTVRRYEQHASGWVTWQVGQETGLAQPKNWRFKQAKGATNERPQ